MISIKTNIAKFISTELRDMKNDINKATRSATNKTARQAANAGKKAVRETYTIPAKELNQATKVISGTNNNPTAKIQVTGGKLSLNLYRALKNKIKGASAMIIKGKRVIIPGTDENKSFYAKMKSGHKGIFYRVGKERLKIKERVGPSAPDLMRSRKAYNAIRYYVKVNYDRIYNSEYNYFKKK